MAKLVPVVSATTSTTAWGQYFGSTSRQDVGNLVIHTVGNIYFNTTNADSGAGYLSAGTYSLGPIDPSTVWVKAISTTNTISGYMVIP